MAVPTFQVSMRLRGSGIVLALQRLRAENGRMPDYLANKAANAISFRAWQTMPRVKPYSVDQELEVQKIGVTVKGNLSKAKKPRNIFISSQVTDDEKGGVFANSLASFIVLASFYKGSRYNQWTGGVFARSKPGTSGSAAFWAWMADTVARMTKARHSATGFYAACARAVNVGFGMALGRFAPAGVKRASVQMSGDVNKISTLLNKGLAQVYPAQGGTGRARFTVAGTEPDAKAARGDLERVAGAVWQRAVEAEAESILKKIAEDYKGMIRAGGFVVK